MIGCQKAIVIVTDRFIFHLFSHGTASSQEFSILRTRSAWFYGSNEYSTTELVSTIDCGHVAHPNLVSSLYISLHHAIRHAAQALRLVKEGFAPVALAGRLPLVHRRRLPGKILNGELINSIVTSPQGLPLADSSTSDRLSCPAYTCTFWQGKNLPTSWRKIRRRVVLMSV